MREGSLARAVSYMPSFFAVCKGKFLKRDFPIRADFNITKRCNLRCSYCYVDFDDLKNKEDLTLDQIKRIICDLHVRGMRSVRLMGGEPLIRQDIGEIIEFIRQKRILCEINTNGYFVKRCVEDLKKVDSVCVSLDGEREANDAMRGKGSYDKAIEALEILLANGIPARLHGMISKYTTGSLKSMAELARSYGVTFTCAPCCVPDLDKRDPNLSLTLEEFVGFFRECRALKQQGYPVLTSYRSIDMAINWPFGEKFVIHPEDLQGKGIRQSGIVPCQYGHKSCYIDADGGVYACSTQWKVGLNYFEHGFDKCWEYLQRNITCLTCRTINDFSLLFDLDASVIKEVLGDVFTTHTATRRKAGALEGRQ